MEDDDPEHEVTAPAMKEAMRLLNAGKPRAAMDALDRVASYEERHPELTFVRALGFVQLEDREQAMAALDRTIRRSPDIYRALSLRASFRMGDGDVEGALADVSAAIALHDNAEDRHLRGQILFRQGRVKAAIVDYDRALELNPNDQNLILDRAKARQAAGDAMGAADDAVASGEFEGSDPTVPLMQFTGLMKEGRLKEALAAANEAIERAPLHFAGYTARALVHQALGNHREQRADLNQAIEYGSKSASVFLSRAVLRQMDGDLRGAAADAEKAVEYEPHDPELWWYLGGVFDSLRDPRAKAILLKANAMEKALASKDKDVGVGG